MKVADKYVSKFRELSITELNLLVKSSIEYRSLISERSMAMIVLLV
jgi:hypothetical protein